MITVCPVCSRSVVAHWPEFWPYRRGEAYYCSQNCYDISLTRDLNMLHTAARKRREAKVARMKKDGTPANRPGPKTKKIEIPEGNMTVVATKAPTQVPTVKLDGALRIETPEAEKVEVVKEIPKKNALKYKVTGIETEVGEFWVVSNGKIKWIPGRLGKEDPVMQVMMTTTEPSLEPETWRRFAEIILEVIELLEVRP